MITTTKILLVDDETDILEFLSYNFRKHNFQVIIANNGMEGIEKAREELPEIIISDILMPEMDGIQMFIEIKKNEGLLATPFIFLSAVRDDYVFQYAMFNGANQFVQKPVRFEYLLKLVNRSLEDKQYKSEIIP